MSEELDAKVRFSLRRGFLIWLVLQLMSSSLNNWPNPIIDGVMITLDNVRKFAPKVILHLNEVYLPCDIGFLLQGSTLTFPSGSRIDHPSQADLAANPASENVLCLDRVDRHGFPLVNGAVDAPFYVAIQAANDASFFDMTFFFVFAFNGAQTARLDLGFHKFNASAVTMGEHQGDLECCTVRVDRDFTRVLMVRTEAHGDGTFLAPDALSFDGTRPIVNCALSSHGVYNAKGMNPNDWVTLGSFTKVITFIDILTQSGPVWNPGVSASLDSIRFVGLDAKGNPIGSELWAKFAGCLGQTCQNVITHIDGIGGQLSPGELVAAAFAQKLANDYIPIYKPDLLIGNGPTGLASKALIYTFAPSSFPKSSGSAALRSNPKAVTPSVIRYHGVLLAYLTDPIGDGVMTAASLDDGETWLYYGYTGCDTSFSPLAVAYGEEKAVVFLRSNYSDADDVFFTQRNDFPTGKLDFICKLRFHCDQQPRAAYDTTVGLILLGRNSLTHWCITAAPNGAMVARNPLPLSNVACDAGVTIFDDQYHVFGTCQDGTVQWISSSDGDAWHKQWIALEGNSQLPVVSASTVAPVVVNGQLYVFYRDAKSPTALHGLQLLASKMTWLDIYAGDNAFPADSVPVPIANLEGGISVFFWEAGTNAMISVRIPL